MSIACALAEALHHSSGTKPSTCDTRVVEVAQNDALRGQNTVTRAREAAGTEFFTFIDDEPAAGERPGSVEDPWPQGSIQRHRERCIAQPSLDVPGLHMAEETASPVPAWVVEGLGLQHTVEQVVDAPAPLMMDMEDDGEVDERVSRERAVPVTAELFVDVPGPQILGSSAELVPQEREQQRGSSKWNKIAVLVNNGEKLVPQRVQPRKVGQVDVPAPERVDDVGKLVPERVQPQTVGQVCVPAPEHVDDAGMLFPRTVGQIDVPTPEYVDGAVPRTVGQVDVPAPEHVDDVEMLVPRAVGQVDVPAPEHVDDVEKLVPQERVRRNIVGHAPAGQVGDVHGPQFRDFPPERVSERIDAVPQAVQPSDRELLLLRAHRVMAEMAAAKAEAEAVDAMEGMVEEFDESVDRFELSHWRPMRLCRPYQDRGCTREWGCTFAHGAQELHPRARSSSTLY